MADDLVPRLLAAIDETERVARACEGREWETRFGPSADDDEPEHWVAGLHVGDTVAICGEDYTMAGKHAAQIARNDPASVLRRCAADRELVALHPQCDEDRWLCELCRDEGQNLDCTYPCDTLRRLAEGYGITGQPDGTPERT